MRTTNWRDMPPRCRCPAYSSAIWARAPSSRRRLSFRPRHRLSRHSLLHLQLKSSAARRSSGPRIFRAFQPFPFPCMTKCFRQGSWPYSSPLRNSLFQQASLLYLQSLKGGKRRVLFLGAVRFPGLCLFLSRGPLPIPDAQS